VALAAEAGILTTSRSLQEARRLPRSESQPECGGRFVRVPLGSKAGPARTGNFRLPVTWPDSASPESMPAEFRGRVPWPPRRGRISLRAFACAGGPLSSHNLTLTLAPGPADAELGCTFQDPSIPNRPSLADDGRVNGAAQWPQPSWGPGARPHQPRGHGRQHPRSPRLAISPTGPVRFAGCSQR
jgi:hypothetical protein